MKELEYYIKKIDKNDRTIIITTFIMGLINYIYLLTHNCLSHDGLFNGPIYKSGNWEFDLGRPMLIIIDKLKGGLVAPSVNFIIGMICISITLIIIKKMLKIEKKTTIILMSILLVIFPTIADTALYIYCFDSYCIAMLLSTLAAYLIIKKKSICAIISIACSLAIYQAYISMTISLLIIYSIIEIIEDKINIKRLIKNMIIVLIGIITYYIGLRIGMLIFHRTLASYKGANELGISTLINIPKNIISCYKDLFNYLFNDNIIYNTYYKRNIFNGIILLCFIITIINTLKRKKLKDKIGIILLLLILPISICIMNLIASGTNIIILTGIGFYTLYLLMINIIDKYKNLNIIRNTSLIIMTIMCFTLILSDNAEFMAREDIHNNFYQRTSTVLNRVMQLDNYSDEMKWMFSNVYTYKSELTKMSLGFVSNQNETFENLEGLRGIKIFYKRYLGIDIELVDYETYKKISNTKEFKNMKINTEKIIDNTIVIKNSESIY